MGHLAINAALVAALIWFTTVCRAEMGHRISIFQVRKSIPLSDNEPVYRDFYISSGEESGIRVSMIIPVKRRVPVHDPVFNRLAGDLYIEVGELEIIHVGDGLSVGRMISTTMDKSRPILDFEGFMVGDRIDIDNARLPASEIIEAPIEMRPDPNLMMKQVQKPTKLPPRPKPKSQDFEGPRQNREAKTTGPLLL